MAVEFKSIGQSRYLHVSQIPDLDPSCRDRLQRALSLANVSLPAFNVIKLESVKDGVSFLDYPNFEQDPFPALRRVWTVDLERSFCRFSRNYS